MSLLRKSRLLTVLLCLIICLSGCRHTNAESPISEDHETLPSQESELVLRAEKKYLLPGGCSVRGVARINNTIMLYGYQNGVPVLGITNYSFAEDTTINFSETKLFPLDKESPYYSTVLGITAGMDGFFYILAGEYPPEYMIGGNSFSNPDYQGKTAIIQCSSSGEFLDKMELSHWHEDNRFGIAVDTKSRVYIMGESDVASFSWGSEEVTICELCSDSYVCSISATAKGVVLCAYERDSARYYLMEKPDGLTELQLNNPSNVPTIEVGNMSMCQGLNGEYIVSANSQFLAFDLENKNGEVLYQWDYTAYPSGCRYACRLSEKCFACTVGEDYLLITHMVEQPVIEKSEVKVAAYDMDRSNVAGIITELNLQGGPYHFQLISYSRDDEQRLLTDLMAGGEIDLIIFNNNLNVNSNTFEDLYQFIDNDPEINRSDFIPGILSALSDNGQLHELWEGVNVNTIAARETDVAGRENLRPQDYQELLMKSNQYESVFQSFMDDENLLKWIAEVGIVKYVNLQTGTCRFDDQGFVDLLAWCKTMGDSIEEGSDSPNYDYSQIILSLEIISSPIRIRSIRTNFGEPYQFVGFPSGGKGISYFSCTYNGSMAIPVNSSNKEGAWAYIKNRVSFEQQLSINYALPINNSALLRKCETELNQEETRQLYLLLEEVTIADRFSNDTIKDIILECGKAYLSGDKTLEETIFLIQTRATIYLSEKYG